MTEDAPKPNKGGRPSTGSITGGPGRYAARITMPDGRRKVFALPAWYSEDQAIAKAKEMAVAVKMHGVQGVEAVEIPKSETVSEWWVRYLAWKESKGQRTVKDAGGRFTNWIEPVIGHLEIRMVKGSDLAAVVAKLDAAVMAGEIESKTAGNIWGEVTAAMKQAATAKAATRLKVRDDNPAEKVQGPDDDEDDKEHCIAYPAEALALFSCPLVPLYRRRAYAVAIYQAVRSNELAALTAGDIDFVNKRISITKQVDRKTREDRRTKTKKSRTVDIEPTLLLLLRILADERPTGRLLHMPPDEDRAELLRQDMRTALECANIAVRADLLLNEGTADRLPLRFHDLRHAGLTWRAVRGDDAMRIQWCGGHTTFKTTQGYLDAGRDLAPSFTKPFPPLPAALLQPQRVSPWVSASRGSKRGTFIGKNVVTPTGIEPVLPA